MIQLSQADIAIHECTFQAYFEKSLINLRFPSLFFIEWKTVNAKNSVSMIGRKKASNSIVQFKQSLTFTTEMIFHRAQKQYLKKQSLLHLNLISNSRPDQIKLVGRILIDLSQIANNQKYSQLTVQKLTYCSVDAELQFKIKMSSSFQSQKQYNQLDKSSFGDLYAITTSKSGVRKQKDLLQQRRIQQQKKSRSKINTLKQQGNDNPSNNFQSRRIIGKQFVQSNNKNRDLLKNIQILEKHTPLNSIESENLQILIKKQKEMLQKELNEHKNRIKKLQTDIKEMMRSYKQTEQKSQMTNSKLMLTENVVTSLKENEDKIKLALQQKQNEIELTKAGYEADIKILKGTIEELKISMTQNNVKLSIPSNLQSLRNQLNNKQSQCISLQAQIQKLKSQNIDLTKKYEGITIENKDIFSQIKNFEDIIKQKDEAIVNINNLLKYKEENYSLVVGQFQQKLKDALNQLSIVQEESHRHLITTSQALIQPNNKTKVNNNEILDNYNNLKAQYDHLKAQKEKLQRKIIELSSLNDNPPQKSPAVPTSQWQNQIFILKQQHEIQILQIKSLKEENLLLKQKLNSIIVEHEQLTNYKNAIINGNQTQNLVHKQQEQHLVEVEVAQQQIINNKNNMTQQLVNEIKIQQEYVQNIQPPKQIIEANIMPLQNKQIQQIRYPDENFTRKINQPGQILQKSFDNQKEPIPVEHTFNFQQHADPLSHEQVNNLKQNKITHNEEELQYLKYQNVKLKEQVDEIKLKLQQNAKSLHDRHEQIIKIKQQKVNIEYELKQIINKYDQLGIQLQNQKNKAAQNQKEILIKGELQKQNYLKSLELQNQQLRLKLASKQTEEKKNPILKLESEKDRQFLHDLQNRLITEQQQNRIKDELLAEGEKHVEQLYALKYELGDLKEKYQELLEALDERDQIINYLQETKTQLSKQLQQIQKTVSFKQLTQTQAQESELKIIQEELIIIKGENQLIKNQFLLIKNDNQYLKHQNDILKQQTKLIDHLKVENQELKHNVQVVIAECQQLRSGKVIKQQNENVDKGGDNFGQELKQQIISSLKIVKQGLQTESEALKIQELANNRTSDLPEATPQLSYKSQQIESLKQQILINKDIEPMNLTQQYTNNNNQVKQVQNIIVIQPQVANKPLQEGQIIQKEQVKLSIEEVAVVSSETAEPIQKVIAQQSIQNKGQVINIPKEEKFQFESSNIFAQNPLLIQVYSVQSQRSSAPMQPDNSTIPYDYRQLHDHIGELMIKNENLMKQIEVLTNQLSQQSQQKFVYFNELHVREQTISQLQNQLQQLKQQINRINSLPLNSFDSSPIKTNDQRLNTQTVLQEEAGARQTSIIVPKVKAQNQIQTPTNKTQTQLFSDKKQGETNISTKILDEELQKLKRQYQSMKQQLQTEIKVHNELKILYEIDQQRYTALSIHYENCLREIQFINFNLSDITNQKANLNQQLNYFKNKVTALQENLSKLNYKLIQSEQKRQQPQMIIEIKQQFFDNKQNVKLQKIITIDQMIIPATQNKEPICQITIQNVEKSVETNNEIIPLVKQQQKVAKEEIMIVEQVVSEKPIESITQNNNNILQQIQQLNQPVIAVSPNQTPQIILPPQQTQQSIEQPIHINQIQIKNHEISSIKQQLNQLKLQLQIKLLQIVQLKLIAQQHNNCLIQRQQWQQKLNQISQKLSEEEIIRIQKKKISEDKNNLPQQLNFEDYQHIEEQHRLITTNNQGAYKAELEVLRNEKLEYMESVVKLQSKLNELQAKNQEKIINFENQIKIKEASLQELQCIISQLTKEAQQLKLKLNQKQLQLNEGVFQRQNVITKLNEQKPQAYSLKQKMSQSNNILQIMSLELQQKQVEIANKVEQINRLQLQLDEFKQKAQFYQEIINNYKSDQIKHDENYEKLIMSQQIIANLNKQIELLKVKNEENHAKVNNILIQTNSNAVSEDLRILQVQEQLKSVKQKYQLLSQELNKVNQEHRLLLQQIKVLAQQHKVLTESHKIMSQQHGILQQDYNILNSRYKILQQEQKAMQQKNKILIQEHMHLQQGNKILSTDYKSVSQEIAKLNQDHKILLNNYNEIKLQLAQKEAIINKYLIQLQKQKQTRKQHLKTSQQQSLKKQQSIKMMQQQNLNMKKCYQQNLKQKQSQLLNLIKQYNGLKMQNLSNVSKVRQLAFKEREMKSVILLIERQTNKVIENIKSKEREEELLWSKYYQKERQCNELRIYVKQLAQQISNKDRNILLLEQQFSNVKRDHSNLKHQYEQNNISPKAITIQYEKYDKVIQSNDKMLAKNKQYIDLLSKKSGLSVQNQKLKHQAAQQNNKMQQLSINLSNVQLQHKKIESELLQKISVLNKQKQQLTNKTLQLINQLQTQKSKKIQQNESYLFRLILQKNKEIQQLKNNYNNLKSSRDKQDNSILNEQILNLNRQMLEKEEEMNIILLGKDQEISKLKEMISQNGNGNYESQNKLKSQLEERVLRQQQLRRFIVNLEDKLKMLQKLGNVQNKGQPKQQIVLDKLAETNRVQNKIVNTDANNKVNSTTNIDNVNHISADLHTICQQIKQLYNKRNSLSTQSNDPLFNAINKKYQQFQQQFFYLNTQTYLIQQKARFISKELQKVKSAIVKSQNRVFKQKTQLLALLKPCENAAGQIINLSQTLSEKQSQSNS